MNMVLCENATEGAPSQKGRPRDEFHAPVPGAAYTKGKLYLFGSSGIAVVSQYPDIRAWEKTARRPYWRGVTPARLKDFLPMSLARRSRIGRMLDAFIAVAPKEVQQVVMSFPTPYRLGILALAARSPETLDVLQANPCLGFMLTQNHVFCHPKPLRQWDSVRRLLRQRQRDAAEQMGFPATESAARILRRVPADAISIRRLFGLRTALWDSEIRQRLCHIPAITAPVLELLSLRWVWPFISPRLLSDCATVNDPSEARDIARRVNRVMNVGLLEGNQPIQGPLVSLAQINRAYVELMMLPDTQPTVAQPELPLDFLLPESPIAIPRHTQHNVLVEHIGTVRELVAESDELRHCIVSYAQEIAAGECAAYRVLLPERGTLTLVPYADGHWVIDDLRGMKNHALRRTTLWAVAAYLNSRQNLIPIEPDDLPF